ncbi:hypothetical protein GIB67_042538 [Kingdonia uniflora]|uniref:Replication factor A C-terminal domain-containing protein n=1 Tax=Kingdonia uniflora TaxID=39325 RepID=A0A7J7M123_9MAGN|nr:hypothetical protein GIB67_042538 [Kingdonia uniflora]
MATKIYVNLDVPEILNFKESCDNYKKKVINDNSNYWCKTCNFKISIPTPRYCLRQKIEDDTGYINIVAFDNETEILAKTTVKVFYELYNKDNDDRNEGSPT